MYHNWPIFEVRKYEVYWIWRYWYSLNLRLYAMILKINTKLKHNKYNMYAYSNLTRDFMHKVFKCINFSEDANMKFNVNSCIG